MSFCGFYFFALLQMFFIERRIFCFCVIERYEIKETLSLIATDSKLSCKTFRLIHPIQLIFRSNPMLKPGKNLMHHFTGRHRT